MKKGKVISLKKALVILTALVSTLAITTACSKTQTKKYSEYVTNENGEYVTNEKGEIETTILDSDDVSVEYVTDNAGKKTIDENGEYVTVLHIKKNQTVVDENGNVIKTKVDVANTTAYLDDSEVGQTSAVPETTVKVEGTTKTSERLFETKVMPIFKSGKFTMKMSFTGNLSGTGNVAMPMVVAYDLTNNRFYMETKMAAIKLKCIAMNNKMYLVMPSLLSYSEQEYSEEEGDLSDMMGQLSDDFSNTKENYVKTSNVTFNKKECVCEEYKKDGIVYKYIFQKSDDKFVRMEVSDSETGETTIINIDSLSAGADESYFKIPKGYKKLNMDDLANSLGKMG